MAPQRCEPSLSCSRAWFPASSQCVSPSAHPEIQPRSPLPATILSPFLGHREAGREAYRGCSLHSCPQSRVWAPGLEGSQEACQLGQSIWHKFQVPLNRPPRRRLELQNLSISTMKEEKNGFPWWLSDKESTCQCRRHRFDPLRRSHMSLSN